MKKIVSAVLLVMVLGVGAMAFAQSNKSDDKQSAADEASTVQKFYRLDYVLRELDGNKEVSKRNYTITVRSGNSLKQLRTGTRVPVATGPGVAGRADFQYMDVGVNIDTMTRQDAGGVWADVTADLTSIATNDAASTTPYAPPQVRQAKISGSVRVMPGKSALVFSADEPTSSRRFELSVTATEVK